jgi:hypothetical protein
MPFLFVCLCVTGVGLIHGTNVIDGLNGLAVLSEYEFQIEDLACRDLKNTPCFFKKKRCSICIPSQVKELESIS